MDVANTAAVSMTESNTQPTIPAPAPENLEKRLFGVSLRAILIGLASTALVDLWVHSAELVPRNNTAIVNTSIPVGPFNVLFALVIVNVLITRLAPRWRLTSQELLTIYVMCAVSTVLSSSGGIHFLIPTITAVHYFGNANNQWAETFGKAVPDWLTQNDPDALKAFYLGSSQVDLSRWATEIAIWSAFLLVFACATLCLSLILRKQWIESEHLPFPTVTLPLEIASEKTPLFRNSLFWMGFGLPFLIVCWNTFQANYPALPGFSLRGIDVTNSITSPPWNAMGRLKFTFFPFAVGIGYLLSTEVVFSVWFFYVVSKLQAVFGSAMGWTIGTDPQSTFPYLTFQGSGAFLGLAVASIWISRHHLKKVFASSFGLGPDFDPLARKAVYGLAASAVAMVTFTVVAGASRPVAALFVLLVLLYLVAATRIRAETGNAWPAGPEVDAFRLMVTVGGSAAFSTSELTALSYVRAATAGQDFRGVCMPHELDGLKIADSAGIKPGKLAGAMVLAIAFGVVVSFIIALIVWTHLGGLAKADPWRTTAGQRTFVQLSSWLTSPVRPNGGGMFGIGFGAVFTMFLAWMRTRYVWWPFHPVGYCMSNTFTAYNLWFPSLIAWLAKVMLTRSGGMKLYRQALPFFLGLIAGDFIGGGLTTLIGCLTSINVYPMNW